MAITSTEANCLIDIIGDSPPIELRLSEGIGAAALFLADKTANFQAGEDINPDEQDWQRLYVVGVNGLPVHGESIENVAVLSADPEVKSRYGLESKDRNSKFFGKIPSGEDFRYAALHRPLEAREIEEFHAQHPTTVQVSTGYELLRPELVVPRRSAVFSRTHIVAPYVKIC